MLDDSSNMADRHRHVCKTFGDESGRSVITGRPLTMQ